MTAPRSPARPGLRDTAGRWAMGALGSFLANSPLFRLPESLYLEPSLRLLEVGCGRGSLLRMLNERLRFDRAPVGVDLSPAALRLADRDERKASRPSRLALATATALPFAEQSFDLVLCGHLVRRLSDGELHSFLSEIRRVLASGGLALLWEFAPTGNARLDAWNRWVIATAAQQPQLRSSRDLIGFAERAGFEFVRDAALRPFLLPPIPRASILIGNAPDGWLQR